MKIKALEYKTGQQAIDDQQRPLDSPGNPNRSSIKGDSSRYANQVNQEKMTFFNAILDVGTATHWSHGISTRQRAYVKRKWAMKGRMPSSTQKSRLLFCHFFYLNDKFSFFENPNQTGIRLDFSRFKIIF